MFWNNISFVYDLFENVYNSKANNEAARIVEDHIDKDDKVLECACGTGLFTVGIARKCRVLTATDFAERMLMRTAKKLDRANIENCSLEYADITDLEYDDDSVDKIVAANVIHLLDDPERAMREFERIVKPGGEILIPTYINMEKTSASFLVRWWNKMGANFKRQFDLESYKSFFERMEYRDVTYEVAQGRMPCAVAVIRC